VKIFGRNIQYSPEETAEARMRAIASGDSLRSAAKVRVYLVTAGRDCFKIHYVTYGCLEVVKIHLVLGLRYLFRRLEKRRLTEKGGLSC
jgi:hypothetical protein